MLHIVAHAAALLALAILCWLTGSVLDRFGFLAADVGALAGLRRLVLGIGGWIAVTFVLAAAGQLRLATLSLVALAVVAGALWASRLPRPAGGTLPRPAARAWPAFAVLAAALAPLYFLALTPTVSWDASVYHLALPKLYLAHAGFRPVDMNVYSTWPLNVELLFAVALAVYDHVLAKLVHFGFGLATLYALWVGCRAFHRPASGWIAMPLLLANGVVAFEIRSAYVDLAYAFFFVAGFLFMIQALDREPRALWLAGICCGMAAGVKITGIACAAFIGALYLPRLVRAWRRREAMSALLPFLIRFALPVLALWVPWLVRTAWLTGNPFYPLLHERLGGPDWSSTLTGQLQAWQSSIGMGRTPVDYLLLPVRIFLEGGQGYHRFDGELGAFWLALIPLAVLMARRVPLVRRCLAVSGLYFVFWSLSAQQMRFLIPVLPLLAIAGAVAVVELLDRLPRAEWRRAGRALGFAAAIGLLIAGQSRVLVAGYRTLGVYLSAQGDLVSTAVHPVYRFVNDRLEPDAKLLMLGTNQRFFCDREVLADSFFEASQIADWLAPAQSVPELRERLAGRDVSHVLLDHRPLPIAYPATLGELLGDPGQVERVYHSPDGRYSVFELREVAGR